MSVYGDRYPGDPAFAPVFDVNSIRRRAVVFVHPTVSGACRGLLPGNPGIHTPEFPRHHPRRDEPVS